MFWSRCWKTGEEPVSTFIWTSVVSARGGAFTLAAFTVKEYEEGLEGTFCATMMIPVWGEIWKTGGNVVVTVYSHSALGPISLSAAETMIMKVPGAAPGDTVPMYRSDEKAGSKSLTSSTFTSKVAFPVCGGIPPSVANTLNSNEDVVSRSRKAVVFTCPVFASIANDPKDTDKL